MSSATFPAYRFDGRSAEATPVAVRVENGDLIVETCDGSELERHRVDRCLVSEPFEHVPRLISLQSGSTLEVRDEERRFVRALGPWGVRSSLAVRMQAWWPAAVVALAALVALTGVVYFKWLPSAVHWVAFALPPRLEARMGDQILSVVDERYFKPSRLDATQRAQISDRFTRAAAVAAPGVAYRLEFRFGGEDVINAMALPGGVILLLDELVPFAESDDRVLAVLGHELGHVVHKHSARQVLQSVGIGALASLLWGDFSGVAASVPLVLGMLRYSRDFEREADAFAVSFLRAQGLSSRPLYEFFARLRDYEDKLGMSATPSFLSSHPSTDERLERLKTEIE